MQHTAESMGNPVRIEPTTLASYGSEPHSTIGEKLAMIPISHIDIQKNSIFYFEFLEMEALEKVKVF